MKNKGFTLIELLAVIVILTVLMMVVMPSINKMIKSNNEKKYSNYEQMMIEYAIIDKDKIGDDNKIYLNELQELNDVKKECTGYVLYDNNQYSAYISCGDKYQTTGYVE